MTDNDRASAAIDALRGPHHDVESIADPAWRFDLWCLTACFVIAGVTFLAIKIKTGVL